MTGRGQVRVFKSARYQEADLRPICITQRSNLFFLRMLHGALRLDAEVPNGAIQFGMPGRYCTARIGFDRRCLRITTDQHRGPCAVLDRLEEHPGASPRVGP
jgi:hypothetical protein